MSVPANGNMLLASEDGGYRISRSVRFRASASAYFNRTLSTPTNNKIWTWSGWVKRGSVSNNSQGIFESPSSGSTFASIYFTSGDIINWYDASGGATVYILQTTQVFRDPSAWYHIVCAYDSTQATASNRQKMYVNGVQITAFSTAIYVAQNTNGRINSAVSHKIGTFDASSNYLDGYQTEVNFIDGQALTPTSFGAFDAVTGVWNPIRYSGTYGTNGFYLNFSDNSAATAAAIGKDYSGNGNNWTPNNISVTAGTTYDSMVDSPTNYGSDTGAGGEVRGNYCTLNPLDSRNVTVSNGNLQVTYATAAWSGARATMPIPKTGKWKWEVTPTTMTYGFLAVAMASADLTTSGYTATNVFCWYFDSGEVRYSNNNVATGKTVSVNDVCEVQIDNGAVSFYKNGTLQHTFTQTLNDITADYFPAAWIQSGAVHVYNFGQRPFTYTVSGFKALCTQNISVPTVLNGANYMAATLYTGNGTSQSLVNTVNGISFQPDLVWTKCRSTVNNHGLLDSVRGISRWLGSNTTQAEDYTAGAYVTAFNSNGFSVGIGGVSNENGQTYVGWQWKGGGAAVTNTAGSITSSVSANTTAGFSILTYTGNGTVGATVGHGLGVTPGMVIVKSRSTAQNWPVKILPYMTGGQRLELNTTSASTTEAAGSGSLWNATNPNSTVITLGDQAMTNANGTTYVAYCWSQITGYSAFTTYTGNGSGDGPFVYCGFRPRWLMIKRYDSAGDPWWLVDSTRSPYNQTTLALRPNSSNAEDNGGNANFDFLSNGFKARTSGGGNGNESGATYIVAAFAENPFTLARAR